MKKLIAILSFLLLPLITLAQDQSFRMMNFMSGRYGCNGFESSHSVWKGMYFLFFTPLVFAIIAILLFIFWISMLIDAIKHAPEKTKIIWVIVIILLQLLGSIIYYFVEKRPRHKTIHHAE